MRHNRRFGTTRLWFIVLLLVMVTTIARQAMAVDSAPAKPSMAPAKETPKPEEKAAPPAPTVMNPPVAPAAPTLTITIQTLKNIYSSREGLQIEFTLKALSRTKICLDKDILNQMDLHISRSGEPLTLQPLVSMDNRELFHERMNVQWLESGQTLTFRANLRRFHFMDGESWTPGEYTVSGSFDLCEQTPGEFYDPAGKETPVPAKNTGWFMIMSHKSDPLQRQEVSER